MRDENTVVAASIAEGQRSDAVLAAPVLAEAVKVVGRIDETLGDRSFDSDKIREACLDDHNALPVIPNRKNRKKPWSWDETIEQIYKQRNRV